MLYHAQKTNSLSLSLFSLPRFSCGTLSGASSHFALVASHSVSLPNIVGVVFCTRIRIRSSSGTMKLTKGKVLFHTRRKEREKKVESPPPPLLFFSVLFLGGRRKEGVDEKNKKTKKKTKEAREKYILRESAGQKSK